MRRRLSSPLPSAPLVIAGGGLAGLTLAAGAAALGLPALLLEAGDGIRGVRDQRTTAIALAGRNLLQQIGVWPALAANAAPIRHIRIADRNRPGALDFTAREAGVEAFGWIVDNQALRTVLWERATSVAKVRIRTGIQVMGLCQTDQQVDLDLANGQRVTTRLLVAADGKNSMLREMAGLGTVRVPYRQAALVANICHERPHGDVALEHFLPGGPLALLPRRGRRMALVWTERPARAQRLLQMAPEAFAACLQQQLGDWLGPVVLDGPRSLWPLSLTYCAVPYAGRALLLGDAAHAIHPIAGQGFNLTLRDVAVLLELLAATSPAEWGGPEMMSHWSRRVAAPNAAMVLATDWLDRLFLMPGLGGARRLGLEMVGQIPPLKKFFMRTAMGMAQAPTLMRAV